MARPSRAIGFPGQRAATAALMPAAPSDGAGAIWIHDTHRPREDPAPGQVGPAAAGPRHSARSATIGSTFVARRAGRYAAAAATPSISVTTLAKLTGSVAVTL